MAVKENWGFQKIWVSNNTMEQMPMWCPPTPPQQDGDMYIDQTIAFLYDSTVMPESQLPAVYIKKEAKRNRHEAGLLENRRAIKIHRKDESTYPPRSLFERPSPALVKMRRDIKLAKYRGIVRPPVPIPGMKFAATKPAVDPVLHEWTIHEDMALLKVIQSFQGLPLNLMIISPGHTPNWDFVADYVNTVSITFRSPKQCRNRYETVLVPREEGKHVMDTSSPRKKKNKGNVYKFPVQIKSNRPMRTAQLYAQDNNATFSQFMVQRYDALKTIAVKKTTITKTVVNTPMLKNPKHASILSEAGIDLDHPLLPVEVAARRAERVAREKKTLTPEQMAVVQKLQLLRAAQQNSAASAALSSAGSPSQSSSPLPQVSVVQSAANVSTVTTTVLATPSTPPNPLRTQRLVASPLQNPTVVSVSGLSPAQLQAATQRLIVSGTPAKGTLVGGTATVAGKTISPAQLQMIRQATLKQQQMRLQSGGLTSQGVKTTTVTIAGQTAVQVQFTQAQPRTQYIQKSGTVTGKQGFTRTVTESEMAQLLKRQQQLQQQKLAAGGQQTISSQAFAQAIQAGPSGQVATLVKAVSSSGMTQTVIGTPIKTLGQGLKTSMPQQLRTLQIQQQLLAQKKLSNQKLTNLSQANSKGGATQLIVNSKPLSTGMTMQQFQQVIRSPIHVGQQGPVVLGKGTQRVIPVNTVQGSKPTIQVVAATSQGITTTLRPQTSSTLAGALAGIKMQGSGPSAQLLSQVSAALQSQGVRQGSPVRIQTSSGQPIVAVTVQNNQNLQQSNASMQSNEKLDQA